MRDVANGAFGGFLGGGGIKRCNNGKLKAPFTVMLLI